MNPGHEDEHLPVARELIEAYVAGALEDESVIAQIESSEQAMELVARIQDDNEFLTQLAGAWSDDGEVVRPGPPSQSMEGYRILSEIHRGGQGVIYKAVQEHTKRTVAVKVMIGGSLASSRQRVRFEREVELIASLRHPNIVTVFDSGILPDGGHYLAMEYIKGVPLSRAHLFGREEPVDDVELFQLRVGQFAQICDAIQFAHQRGIIHRDLKPGNILVDRDGVPKVFDFGVAKVMGVLDKAEATLTGEFVGTFAYASPEQVKGDPSDVDTRSDVYALGLILYELLTEQHPYPVRGSVSEVIQNITSTEAEPPSRYDSRIGRDLEAIVLKAIQKEPADRYQSAAALADDLRSWMSGEPVDALRDNASYLLRKVARKYRVPILLGTACVAVLLVIS
ncbi:MAG: serine/threonine protein kinase, partial [Phycisphaerales bacterium]|nr:serine/threonine protein kinase [Phycisphaerales bacterium]